MRRNYKIRICPCGNIADRVKSARGRPKICPKCNKKTRVVKASDFHCRYCNRSLLKTNYKKPPGLNLEKLTFYCGCRGWN